MIFVLIATGALTAIPGAMYTNALFCVFGLGQLALLIINSLCMLFAPKAPWGLQLFWNVAACMVAAWAAGRYPVLELRYSLLALTAALTSILIALRMDHVMA